MVGCAEGSGIQMFNNRFERMAMSSLSNGTSSAGGIHLGVQSLTNNPPDNTIGLYPNVVKDSIYALYGAPTQNPLFVLDGELRNSLVFGNDLYTGSNPVIYNPSRIVNSFVDMSPTSTGAEGMFARYNNTETFLEVPTVDFTDSVILGGRSITGSASTFLRSLASDTSFNGGTTKSNLTMNRVFVGLQALSRTHGMLQSWISGSDDTGNQTATINGLTVTVKTTASSHGIGCGYAVGSGLCNATGQGSHITNACVESVEDPFTVSSFGVNRTATSMHLPVLGPDVTDGVTGAPADSPATLAAFVADPRDKTSICGYLAKPRIVGLSAFGTEQANLGDFVAEQINNWTTDTKLLQQFGGGGGGGKGPNIR
jgi:hypothetical protein